MILLWGYKDHVDLPSSWVFLHEMLLVPFTKQNDTASGAADPHAPAPPVSTPPRELLKRASRSLMSSLWVPCGSTLLGGARSLWTLLLGEATHAHSLILSFSCSLFCFIVALPSADSRFQYSFSLERCEKVSFCFHRCLYVSLLSPQGRFKPAFWKVTPSLLQAVEPNNGLMTPEQAILKLYPVWL